MIPWRPSVAKSASDAGPMSTLTLRPGYKLPMPDWDAEWKRYAALPDDAPDKETFWPARGAEWVQLLAAALGEKYRWHQSAHFWLVCAQDRATAGRLLGWTEQVYARLQRLLEGIVPGEIAKTPIVMPADLDDYYAYIGQFYSDGEHATSGGIYLNAGYGHFVFCYQDLNQSQQIIVHEMTHAFLGGLKIPAWLNEGLAQLAEMTIAGAQVTRTETILETIDSYWTTATMQEFWTGTGFNRPDEGQMHSYHLAHVLTRKLTGNRDKFAAFVREADWEDAGEAALVKHFGIRLEELVSDYLGDDDWAPKLSTPLSQSPDSTCT
jgi:hypothetical protein